MKLKSFKLELIIYSILCLNLYSQTDLKINLVTAPFLIPNLAAEIPVASNKSIQIDVLGSFWNEFSLLNNNHFLINQTFLEYRWYKKKSYDGWFIGPNIGYGMFTLKKPNWAVIRDNNISTDSDLIVPNESYNSGRIFFYGFTIGYKKNISKNYFLEFFIGAGLTHSWYKGYRGLNRVDMQDELVYRRFNKSNEWLLYKGGLMFVYRIPNILKN